MMCYDRQKMDFWLIHENQIKTTRFLKVITILEDIPAFDKESPAHEPN